MNERRPESRGGPQDDGNALRRLFSRWASSQAEEDAREHSTRAVSLGGTPCCDLIPRRRAVLVGVLRSVTLRPRAGAPALEAELNDGSGSISLVWLGRRSISGIETGRWVRVEGMVTEQGNRLVIFNPRYALKPGAADSEVQA